jgi:cell division protein FtsN
VATRRKGGQRGASRGSRGTPAWMWLLTGILIGLGLAWYLFAKGYIPQPQAEEIVSGETANQGSAIESEEVAPAGREAKKSKYDFFTVLPEMEVVVPEQELAEKSRNEPAEPVQQEDGGSYVLQVGSFRVLQDAEQLKARLALLGMVARVQTVTVNDATWHRVRVGPVSGARQTDEIRRKLNENDIDSLVLKDQ